MKNRREFISNCSMLGVVALSPIPVLSSEKDYKLTIHKCKRDVHKHQADDIAKIDVKEYMSLRWVDILSDDPCDEVDRRFEIVGKDEKSLLPACHSLAVACNPRVNIENKEVDYNVVREVLTDEGKKINQELIQSLIKDISNNGYKDIHLYVFSEDVVSPEEGYDPLILEDSKMGVVVVSEIGLIGLKT